MITIYSLVLTTLTFGAMFSVLTLSLNLQYARGGMINFGLVAYFAAGAYAYAIFTQEPPSGLDQYWFGFDMPWYIGFIAAGFASLLFALITGWPTLRLRGEYLALTTFAFAEVFHSVLLNERRIGNGSVGLANVERPDPMNLGLNEAVGYALAAVALMLITAWLFNRLLKSPFGRAIDAVHDDETAAQAVGKDDTRIRLQVFIISAIPIGFAGALYAMITTLVAPALFTAEITFFIWIALALGGEKTILGAILGTMALVLFQEIVGAIPFETVRVAQIAASAEEIVTGILFITVLRLRPWEKISKGQSA
tara:strand:+ start:484 stop:1410 length:927 start_codon:yes stop_codon:yes gene_type:complete